MHGAIVENLIILVFYLIVQSSTMHSKHKIVQSKLVQCILNTRQKSYLSSPTLVKSNLINTI
jgi:hypothetical protein